MTLLDYPVPELDVTLQEVSRVLQLTLSPDLYPEFKCTMEQQRELLQEAHQKIATIAAGQENWVTEQFKRALLSCADPLPTSTALPVVLLPSQVKQCTQLQRAAALLWAAAKLYSEPLLLEGNVPMERTQQGEVFADSRIPGRIQDEIKFTCTCHSHAEQAGWKNGKGERVLIEKYGGAVWLTEMDHLGVPFYQAYVEGTGRVKAKAADLLLGLGETVGLGERHSTPEMVQEALRHHAVPEQSYKWYINMRQVKPLLTSGWGMGTERYLCWLLQHDDIRDINIIPRMKGMKYMP